MRRRAKHELGVIVVVALLVAGMAFFNSETRRGSLKEQAEEARHMIEEGRSKEGLDLLDWQVMQKTRGNHRSGPSFDEALLARRDTPVNVVGFMVPLEQFIGVSEFILLPMPIECYFCQQPPMCDVMLVQMKEGTKTNLFNEPVFVNGTLTLNEGPGTKFFYVLKEAELGPGEKGAKLTLKDIPPEHRVPKHMRPDGEDQLLEGQEPPEAIKQMLEQLQKTNPSATDPAQATPQPGDAVQPLEQTAFPTQTPEPATPPVQEAAPVEGAST